ncbi:hypothetical protein [Streptomyces sp. NPDC012888]|uniref:hypothetical protein n=1 Tax=Streptomyces sp. NPDC012888 TaxID=3364855 RepID=UPI00367AEE45
MSASGIAIRPCPVYDGRSSWFKTGGYRLPRHLAAFFREAFSRVYPVRPGDPQAAVGHLAALYEELGHSTARAREFAREFLEAHADDLAAWLSNGVVPPQAGNAP